MDLLKKHCVVCEGGTPQFSNEQEDSYNKDSPSWLLDCEHVHKIHKQFSFKNFNEAMVFVNTVADLAEEEGHHPDICISYSKGDFTLFTHAVGGLSENDFIIAAKIYRITKNETSINRQLLSSM
jgi:4a-hydroxytetrahydrobiopterin dehydratase